MVFYTDGDTPIESGKYICWVNPDVDVPFAKTIFLMWIDGEWFYLGSDCKYRDVVYGFAGPLPSLRLKTVKAP